MSCFIVEDSTINRIIKYIYYCEDVFIKGFIEEELNKIGFNIKEDDIKKLGEEFLKYNVMAFYIRYYNNKQIKEEVKKAIKEYKFNLNEDISNKYQVLKSLRCYLYQISEGDIDKTKFYKFLEDLSYKIMYNLIDSTEQYNKAKWG